MASSLSAQSFRHHRAIQVAKPAHLVSRVAAVAREARRAQSRVVRRAAWAPCRSCPPPPTCIARRLQLAGSSTRKLMGFPCGSLGAIEPSTSACATALSVASTQRGGDSVTPPTGSPMAEAGIEVPTFSTVTSAAVITRSPVNGGSFDPGAGMASAAVMTAGKTNHPARKRKLKCHFQICLAPSLEIQLQRLGEVMPGVHPRMTAVGDETFMFNLHFLQVLVERHRLLVEKILRAHAEPQIVSIVGSSLPGFPQVCRNIC